MRAAAAWASAGPRSVRPVLHRQAPLQPPCDQRDDAPEHSVAKTIDTLMSLEEKVSQSFTASSSVLLYRPRGSDASEHRDGHRWKCGQNAWLALVIWRCLWRARGPERSSDRRTLRTDRRLEQSVRGKQRCRSERSVDLEACIPSAHIQASHWPPVGRSSG
jgi:hypothetical protein